MIQDGRVFIDRQPLEERYLGDKLPLSRRSFPEFEIPHRSYYVLGDNRDASNDSRMWGPLSADLIYGKVMFK
jgi:signal peptidase I